MKSITARNLMYTSFGSSALSALSSTLLVNYLILDKDGQINLYEALGFGILVLSAIAGGVAGFYFKGVKERKEIKERNYALSHSLEDITQDIQYTPVGRGKRLKAKLR